jgi:hypothetical protein
MMKLMSSGLVRQASLLECKGSNPAVQLNPNQGHLMSTSTILTVCLSIAVGYILASALNRTSAGQPPPPEPVGQEGQVWRYQLLAAGVDSSPTMYLNDTVTGRVWWRSLNEHFDPSGWHACGSPTSKTPDRVPR